MKPNHKDLIDLLSMPSLKGDDELKEVKEPQKFVFNFLKRLDLRSSNKHVALQNFSIYYTWKKHNKKL